MTSFCAWSVASAARRLLHAALEGTTPAREPPQSIFRNMRGGLGNGDAMRMASWAGWSMMSERPLGPSKPERVERRGMDEGVGGKE